MSIKPTPNLDYQFKLIPFSLNLHNPHTHLIRHWLLSAQVDFLTAILNLHTSPNTQRPTQPFYLGPPPSSKNSEGYNSP